MRTLTLIMAILLGFSALSCESREEKARRLHSWCEVHLDELTFPVLDLRELTGEVEPFESCELWLVDPLRDDLPPFESVLRDRWALLCEGEILGLEPGEDPLPPDTCNLLVWVDPVLLGSYGDGVLHCRPAEGTECPGSPTGRRTRCDISEEELRLGDLDGGEGIIGGSVVSVHAFEPSRELIAVVWNSLDDGRPLVSWLSVDSDGVLSLENEIDICTECSDVIGETVPEVGFAASQTASTNDEGLLLAGPCGASGIVEVDRDGRCEMHPVVEEEEGVGGRIVDPLAVMSTEDGFVALWAEGQFLWMSSMGSRLDRVDSRPIWQSITTMTREYPASVCLPTEGDESECVVLWTERTTGIPREPPAEGDTTIAWDVSLLSGSGDVAHWEQQRRELQQGFGGRFAITEDSWQECEQPGGCLGIFVFRHSTLGLVARSWSAGSTEAPEEDVHHHPLSFAEQVIQLADGAEFSAPALAPLQSGAFAVTWVEQPYHDMPREVGLSMVGAQREMRRAVRSSASVPGFWPLAPDGEHDLPLALQRPLLAKAAGEEAPLLIGVLVEEGVDGVDGCALQVVLVSSPPDEDLPPEGDWPYAVELPLLAGPFDIPAPEACHLDCGGEAAWVEDSFVIALPGGEGVRLVTLTEGEDDEWEVDEMPPLVSEGSDGAPACNIALRVGSGSDENELLLATDFHEDMSEGGIVVWRGVLGSDRWDFDEVSTEGVADGAARSPVFAAGWGSTPLLLWADAPIAESEQEDVGIAVVGERILEDGEFPYGQLVSSSLNSAVAVPIPCDGEGDPEGDNLCAAIAVGRPDPHLEDTAFGLMMEMRRTPLLDVITTPLTRGDEFCPDCFEAHPVGHFEEEWHGLPIQMVWWNDVPFASINALAVHEWWDGEAMMFQLELLEEQHWNSWPNDVGWLAGEEHQNRTAPALRLAGDDEMRGGIWSRRGHVEGGMYTVEYYFSLLAAPGEQIRPASSLVFIDSCDHPEPESLYADRDSRRMLLEALDSDIAALDGDSGYVVAWVDESGVNAARVSCEDVESRQEEGD